jgi:restriction system protein
MKLVDSTQFFAAFTPLLLGLLAFVVIVIVAAYFFKRILPNYFNRKKIIKSFEGGEAWRDDQDLLRRLREMNPMEFEGYIAQLFRSLGYASHAVGRTGDHGVDVEIEKDGVTHLVQCKKYSETNKVGEGEVRNFLGALDHQHARGKGYFITTGYFTLAAEKFAEDKPIELIDGDDLVKHIHRSKNASREIGKTGVNND